ncbi:MAG: hypothetical protein PQ612_05755 [Rickettsiales bacterium]|nr:hypothetical protein [Pseudomonadota bacterium]MDA0966525.1 hypothetical protein [Pseudomonadota bacterium]MDG4543387.1 hypothetical protein [Rickettsiales bacterium]MDG4545653.1 hypothetical protein [Rickettsiales bacterium]MDG4548102.1 hypothetical protein [Rickettsiales bacterium]
MTKPNHNNSSVSKIASSGAFKFSELFEEFKKCNEEYKNDEGKQSYCAFIARRAEENNPKSHHTDEWANKTLEDAGHGRYNGK